MAYAKIENGAVSGYPVSQSYVRWNSGNVSFPVGDIPDHVMAEFGYYPVELTTASFDENTQRVVEIDPVNINGKWIQTWSVIDLTAEEIADKVADKWAEIRDQRNALLAGCDWTQLADAPVDDLAWAVYRQSLRDITTQSDPFSISWPSSL